ncbi:hypothetical protein [Gemmata sp.]|uniref:hypothetical protein n=1 Tax=Gemmata sp. TaxID=1914242 RepID=UPI003F72BB60
MRKFLTGLWACVVSGVILYLGVGIAMFFYRDVTDRSRAGEQARAQVAKDYPSATVTDVTVTLRRESGDVREYAVEATIYLSGEARVAGFVSSAWHPHFLRWWQPTQQHMAARAG